MSSSNSKQRWTVPHVLVLILGLILICCGLTYVLPAGEYAIDAATGLVVPNSFHYLDRSPVDPWRALIMVTEGVGSQGVIFALLFIMGGLINVVIESGAIHSLINYSVYRLEDKSITVLVPSVVVLMAVIGGLAGQDSLVAFVAAWCSPANCGSTASRRSACSTSPTLRGRRPVLLLRSF